MRIVSSVGADSTRGPDRRSFIERQTYQSADVKSTAHFNDCSPKLLRIIFFIFINRSVAWVTAREVIVTLFSDVLDICASSGAAKTWQRRVY
jgi:hypothetical protein